jgi:hypothetical protein
MGGTLLVDVRSAGIARSLSSCAIGGGGSVDVEEAALSEAATARTQASPQPAPSAPPEAAAAQQHQCHPTDLQTQQRQEDTAMQMQWAGVWTLEARLQWRLLTTAAAAAVVRPSEDHDTTTTQPSTRDKAIGCGDGALGTVVSAAPMPSRHTPCVRRHSTKALQATPPEQRHTRD